MSQIASVINQLKKSIQLPQDMATTLLTIIQIGSVDDFNKVFAAIEAQRTRDDLNQSVTASVKCFSYTSADILSVVEVQYLELFEKLQWTGATTKGQESALAAQQWTKFLRYHNYGKPGCRIDICHNPKDEETLKSNRKLFMD
jgi:hypothetical protein